MKMTTQELSRKPGRDEMKCRWKFVVKARERVKTGSVMPSLEKSTHA